MKHRFTYILILLAIFSIAGCNSKKAKIKRDLRSNTWVLFYAESEKSYPVFYDYQEEYAVLKFKRFGRMSIQYNSKFNFNFGRKRNYITGRWDYSTDFFFPRLETTLDKGLIYGDFSVSYDDENTILILSNIDQLPVFNRRRLEKTPITWNNPQSFYFTPRGVEPDYLIGE